MSKAFDPNYYARRLSAELEAAAAATSEQAREAHLALADHYRLVLGRLGHPVAVDSAAADPGAEPVGDTDSPSLGDAA
jgi:hypothetical protein